MSFLAGIENAPLAFFGGIGTTEIVVMLGIGLLLFGKRLPEVGRQLGSSLMQFKKGLHGIESEISSAVDTVESAGAAAAPSYDDHDEPTAPKFEPPTSAPQDASETSQA